MARSVLVSNRASIRLGRGGRDHSHRRQTPSLRARDTARMLHRMDTHDHDIVVIGAGIAGSTCAAALASDHRVALIEAEEFAGYHSTGRSAALWLQNYGPPDVRTLSALSRPFFEHPPAGFAEAPLMAQRTVVFLARADQRAELDALFAEGSGLHEASLATVAGLLPALRPDYAAAAAIEADAFDIDVAALHQGFLRQVRARGGMLALQHRAARLERRDGHWHVTTSGDALFRAPIVVNAAGAWGDAVAAMAGLPPLGLSPCRRTAAIIDPSPHDVSRWPMVVDVGHGWYARPEARTRLLVSPADQTPMHAHDVCPDELDIALGIDRMQRALDIEVRRVERSWAGLRTFSPDGSLACGWDKTADGFFWCVGQGGYGIQTSPAAGMLVADLISGRDPGAAAGIVAAIDPGRFAAR
jgi:D-arginine dehydrogenase